MTIEKEREKPGAFGTRVSRWLRETIFQRKETLLDKYMRESMKERPLSEYKDLLDAGKLEILTPDETRQEFKKIERMAEQVREKLRPRPPEPK